MRLRFESPLTQRQPQRSHFAWQAFDARALHLLRDEHRIRRGTKVTADMLEDPAARMEGPDSVGFPETRKALSAPPTQVLNSTPTSGTDARPRGLAAPKRNWSNTVDEPPIEAYAITRGITCTFSGLRNDAADRVRSAHYRLVPGLYPGD